MCILGPTASGVALINTWMMVVVKMITVVVIMMMVVIEKMVVNLPRLYISRGNNAPAVLLLGKNHLQRGIYSISAPVAILPLVSSASLSSLAHTILTCFHVLVSDH